MAERPVWCEKIKCPVNPGGVVCNLDERLRQETRFLPRRVLNKEFERIEKMAEEDPQKLIDYCVRKI